MILLPFPSVPCHSRRQAPPTFGLYPHPPQHRLVSLPPSLSARVTHTEPFSLYTQYVIIVSIVLDFHSLCKTRF